MDSQKNPIHPLIEALGLHRSPNDATRASVLFALEAFARAVGDEALRAAAREHMPAAHPFQPLPEWMSYYRDGFLCTADLDCGVDPDEYERYGTEFWRAFSDEDRQKRLGNPRLGRLDGTQDAAALNEA